MALKTPEAVKVATPPPPVDDSMLLELVLYTRYTRKRTTYYAKQPYRFTRRDAMILLTETDLQRPIWRIYQPPPPKVEATGTTNVLDATALSMERIGEPDTFLRPTDKPSKRIEVGTDDEIAEILNPPGGEDVTV